MPAAKTWVPLPAPCADAVTGVLSSACPGQRGASLSPGPPSPSEPPWPAAHPRHSADPGPGSRSHVCRLDSYKGQKLFVASHPSCVLRRLLGLPLTAREQPGARPKPALLARVRRVYGRSQQVAMVGLLKYSLVGWFGFLFYIPLHLFPQLHGKITRL